MHRRLWIQALVCALVLSALVGPVAALARDDGTSGDAAGPMAARPAAQPQATCHYLYLPLVIKAGLAGGSSESAPAATTRTRISTNPCATPYVGGPIPLSATTYKILAGAGTVIQEGNYAITANTSKAYRLVWAGSDATQRFYGSIWTTGTFTSFSPGCSDNSCSVGSTGTISSPVNLNGGGQRIDFDTVPGLAHVGLDFVVSAEPVYFDLFIDGVRRPQNVYFTSPDNGGQLSTVGTIPFALTTP